MLAIAPVEIQFNDDGGAVGLYQRRVCLVASDAIQLNAVVGVKGSSLRLKVSPWDQVYQSASCGGWTPSDLGTVSVEVDGVTYNNDCLNDSWFTIGEGSLDGPDLSPTGFNPATLDAAVSFDSEDLAVEECYPCMVAGHR